MALGRHGSGSVGSWRVVELERQLESARAREQAAAAAWGDAVQRSATQMLENGGLWAEAYRSVLRGCVCWIHSALRLQYGAYREPQD
jgi:hypothetical protein